MDEKSIPEGNPPPVFRIDLSLPPSERYVELASLYRDRMRALRGMFDELIQSISPKIPLKLVHCLARSFLRKLYTDEETEELRGISRVTDIDMYLLISLNTVLDLLMGCTSGGVRTKCGSSTKMLHFRTLDWGMDPLRDLIVQLEFRRGDDPTLLATTVTYVGYVGVLTGVRKGLSASLNFRPVHDTSKNLAFYSNHVLVLLGIRQSISSLLRQCIFSSPSARPGGSNLSTLESIVENVPSMPTTAAYFIFSDGATTVTMEKDHRTAIVRSSPSFIVTTNHDQQSDTSLKAIAEDKRHHHAGLTLVSDGIETMADLIEDSNERRDCIKSRWDKKLQLHMQARERVESVENVERQEAEQNLSDQPQGTRSSPRLRRKREKEAEMERRQASMSRCDDSDLAISEKEVISWLTTYPVLNEETHYATIMDPSEGKVVWVKWYDPSEWGE
ncbi:beta subunit of N-acylethanolamine-hydrolyzing acid amidase-domain-containing protein [Penicillium cinerascens]|uniref:ceramidase n=1 Tax=Penicillium cinerascens TaxID=70096 RepID=A0A9W9J887_9EURO|nr:beta subunit of N-acylethanolamine-hydrolyzing acid amidase-domain-containing protein [Penicillium cinerascens]KAJ5191599.1 beta subunit of N-acylethanolamine-hydrolyzing acid amidase-domain-containing protein [Penicillium cinerascens]